MFLLTTLIILTWFAYKDYKTGEVETKELWPMYLIATGFVLLFGNILLSIGIAIAFTLIMLGFQKAKITFLGDTLVIPLIAFLYPVPMILLIGLTIGFILASLSKNKRVSFLPLFLTGFLFALLTSFMGFV